MFYRHPTYAQPFVICALFMLWCWLCVRMCVLMRLTVEERHWPIGQRSDKDARLSWYQRMFVRSMSLMRFREILSHLEDLWQFQYMRARARTPNCNTHVISKLIGMCTMYVKAAQWQRQRQNDGERKNWTMKRMKKTKSFWRRDESHVHYEIWTWKK